VNDECYLVSPPVPGAPLAEAVGRPWDVAQVMGFLDVALEALARMHRRGVVLRNLMPDNLIYTCAPNERLLLIDYGQFVPQRSNPLVAPELWLPIRPDQRTDLYHIGMIAYTLLSGGQPPNLRRGRRPADVFSLPKPLSDTLNQLLDPDPSRRPAHARAALTRLRGRPLLLLRLSIAGLILAVIVGAWLALAYPGILAR
jgi:serine/threonine protein kinase